MSIRSRRWCCTRAAGVIPGWWQAPGHRCAIAHRGISTSYLALRIEIPAGFVACGDFDSAPQLCLHESVYVPFARWSLRAGIKLQDVSKGCKWLKELARVQSDQL